MTWKELAGLIQNLPEEQQNARVKISCGEGFESDHFYHANTGDTWGYFEVTDGNFHPRLEEIVILLDDGVEDGIIKRVPDLHAVI